MSVGTRSPARPLISTRFPPSGHLSSRRRAPPFYVALTLTDGIGTQRVDVRLVDARGPTFHTMREGRAEIPFSDRFMAWETGFRFEDVTFPSPGEYRAQSWVGGELLMERRIVLYPSVDERRTPEES